MANSLWSDSEVAHKIHLDNCPSIYMREEFGGMGMLNLQDMNICLIAAWDKRYFAGEGSLCRKVVLDSKYNTRNPNILCYLDNHPS